METFWKKTCRELYRRTVLTEAQGQEMTDEELDDTMWDVARPWEEQWESFKADGDSGERYVAETQRVAELQHLAVTQGLKTLFRDT
jgi:hypothetical protein